MNYDLVSNIGISIILGFVGLVWIFVNIYLAITKDNWLYYIQCLPIIVIVILWAKKTNMRGCCEYENYTN